MAPVRPRHHAKDRPGDRSARQIPRREYSPEFEAEIAAGKTGAEIVAEDEHRVKDIIARRVVARTIRIEIISV